MHQPVRAAAGLLLLSLTLPACAKPTVATRFETAIVSPPVNSNRFEDDRIAAAFTVYQDAIVLQIRNKTKAPLRVSWSESTFMDIHGALHGISHTHLTPAGMQAAAGFTVIPPRGDLVDTITLFKRPARSGQLPAGAPEPLFDHPAPDLPQPGGTPNDALRSLYLNQSFALLLMIRTDQPIPYRFRFRIKDLKPHAGPPRLLDGLEVATPQPVPIDPAPAGAPLAPASDPRASAGAP